MPVDPDIENMLVLMRATPVPEVEPTAEQARATLAASTAYLHPDSRRPEVAEVVDVDAGGVPARVFRPLLEDSSAPVPTIVHLHGGGFVVGDLDSYDHTIRRLCRDTGSVVVSVAYGLAPERPFPAGVEDSLTATAWVLDHLDELGGSDVVGVAGDSAGGNLAAVVAQAYRDRITAQLLVYPLVDHGRRRYESRRANGSGYGLEISQMSWYRRMYLPDESGIDADDPRLSPIAGDLTGLPAAVVVTAEFDPLRDEGEAYAAALQAAGVRVDAVRYDGLVHGFTEMGRLAPACDEASADMHARFADMLRQP
ncbi:MAG: alpha/beta hydrolase [Nocardioides sp.]|uniref:alpha/beta hydrolase n=1 Tax=Nocardioides sp. TaxID=35761 RepID=UPI003F045CAB